MRLCAAALLIGACGSDPSLRVAVEHGVDPELAALIDTTSITIYEGALRCRDVELGDVHGEELEAFAVTSVVTDSATSSGSFEGISRLDHKVVVARGRSSQTNRLLSAGCAEIDEIVDGSSLSITTVPAATVSLGDAEDGMRGLLVTATDPRSLPIDGRAVSWRLYGPAGTMADPARYENLEDGVWEPKAPSCTSDGVAIVHPVPPQVPAGYAVQARVSWAAERPPLFTLFTPIDVESTGALHAGALQTCAVKRTATTASVICLESATALAEYTLTGSTLSRQALPAIEAAVAVVAVPEEAAQRVYAITREGKWIPVGGAPAANPQQLWCADPICTTFDVQMVPACGDSPSVIIAHVGTLASSSFVTMPVKGGPVSTYRTRGSSILNAGCLTELQADGSSKLRQAIALETSPITPGGATAVRVFFDCAGSAAGCDQLLAGEGVGFVSGPESRMIVSGFDATGAILSTVVVRPDGRGGAAFVERARQDAAAPPQQIVTAQLDADDETDLLWHFAAGRTSNIQIAYAREVEGAPLTALFPTGATVSELLAADLNADGFDEAMFVVDLPAGGRFLAVIPIGRPYAAQATPSDAPCP